MRCGSKKSVAAHKGSIGIEHQLDQGLAARKDIAVEAEIQGIGVDGEVFTQQLVGHAVEPGCIVFMIGAPFGEVAAQGLHGLFAVARKDIGKLEAQAGGGAEQLAGIKLAAAAQTVDAFEAAQDGNITVTAPQQLIIEDAGMDGIRRFFTGQLEETFLVALQMAELTFIVGIDVLQGRIVARFKIGETRLIWFLGIFPSHIPRR